MIATIIIGVLAGLLGFVTVATAYEVKCHPQKTWALTVMFLALLALGYLSARPA